MGRYGTFLFAEPDFIGGVARILDLGGTLNVYNDSPNDRIADTRAMHLDWKAVRADMIAAIKEHCESDAES